jgi:hypothetical protein
MLLEQGILDRTRASKNLLKRLPFEVFKSDNSILQPPNGYHLPTHPRTHAAPVVYEPFAQTAGSISGKAASTTGLTGNWTKPAGTTNVLNPATITHGALANSGGQADVLSAANSNAWLTRNADLATDGLLDNGETLRFRLVCAKVGGKLLGR